MPRILLCLALNLGVKPLVVVQKESGPGGILPVWKLRWVPSAPPWGHLKIRTLWEPIASESLATTDMLDGRLGRDRLNPVSQSLFKGGKHGAFAWR